MTEAPRFTWSYSSITDFFNCPLMFAHKRFYKDVIEDNTVEHLVHGTRIHKGQELALLGEDNPDEDIVKPYRKYVDAILTKATEPGAILLVEHQMCITEAMQPTGWFDSDAWGRGVIDACVIVGDTAYIFDWKTGKVKQDDFQLKLFCAFLSIYYPQVTRFIVKFIWLKFDKITPEAHLVITKDDIPRIWSDTLAKVHRMKQAWDSGVWQAKPSGLCPWCGYNDRCEYKR